MAELAFQQVLGASATVTPKGPSGNQDRAGVVPMSEGGLGAVVLDGIGSWERSGEVAEKGRSIALEALRGGGLDDVPGLPCVVNAALDKLPDGGTTFITAACDSDGNFAYSFVGNGALMLIQACGAESFGTPALGYTDLVIPHVSLNEGRPALTSYLPWADTGSLRVSAGRNYREVGGVARMMMAVSDGIATDEDRPVGRAPDGGAWKAVPKTLLELLDHLAGSWPILATAMDPTDILEKTLEVSLEGLNEEKALDDDATAAVVMWRPEPEGRVIA